MIIDNAMEVLLKAWSVRLITIANVCTVLEIAGQVLPAFQGVVPPLTMAVLALLFGVGGLVARFIKQLGLSPATEPEDNGYPT